MFLKKFFLISIAVILLSAGCERAGQEGQKAVSPAEGQKGQTQEAGENPELITLKPEAVEQAGIKTERVSLRSLRGEQVFSGKVSVNETRLAHVGSRISGRAVAVSANPGDNVEKGQSLAIIDSPELGEAQSQYLKAATNLGVAEKSYERAKMLLEGKVVSTGEFQRREGEYLSAKTEAKAAEDRLHLLGMTDEEISAIGKGHTINSRVPIYSPIPGTIIEKHLTLGEVLEPVKPLFVIADLSNLWVIADVPERDIPKIKKGQRVAITVSPYPEKVFSGKIGYVSETIDPETRTIKVRAELGNPGRMLKPEMFATIKISTMEKENVLVIPVSAIQREGENTIVFVSRRGNAFEKRMVAIGPEMDGFHQVISGLKGGESIVTAGAFTLKSETMKGLMEEE